MKKIYTYFSDDIPNIPLAKLTIEETLFEKSGYIEILDEENVPILVKLAYNNQNNIKGVESLLEDRVMPSNRMFFAEFCKEQGLNPYSIDDRLTLSKGRSLSDNYYVVREVIKDE